MELGPDALADVARYVRLQQYEPGTTVVWQGEASTTVSLMVRGLAVVTRLGGEGQPSHILAYLMPGASFGYVERTLAFLGTRFGGATSTPARGVWQSEAVGLVQEAVHLVQTYATSEDLHRHLPEVVAYVKAIKTELQQEAMALEVDHQLMLL